MTNSIQRIFETPADGHYFFGYFNTPQVSKDGRKLLALKCDFIDRVPGGSDSAQIGYFDLQEAPQTFHPIGTTSAYNWQQGCMLQFCGPDYCNEVIYNTFDGVHYVSEIVNLETGSKRVIQSPIYSMFPSGKFALSLDFARHYWCRRGYSYGNIVDEGKNRQIAPEDGIFLLDIETGSSAKIVSIEDMLLINPLSSMDGATHYLEHMTVNPRGTQFAFLHRWKYPGGIHSRLCVADRFGRNVKILNDSGRMSHYCWRDENRLVGYGGLPTSLNRLRKNRLFIKSVFRLLLPLYHALIRDSSPIAQTLTGDSYIEIDSYKGSIRKFGKSLPNEDGHPAMLVGSRILVTDTYARSKLGQKACLYAYDLHSDQEYLLDELSSIDEFDETPIRCDLHPCVSPSGDVLSIDTMHRGRRSIFAYKINFNKE